MAALQSPLWLAAHVAAAASVDAVVLVDGLLAPSDPSLPGSSTGAIWINKRISIGQCPIFYRTPYFPAKTHAAFVTNVVNGLEPFRITFRTTTEAVVVGSTSNSA